MIVKRAIPRTSKYCVGDLVDLPYVSRYDTFHLSQPIKVIDISVEKTSPYSFKYFLENHDGEREYFNERKLVLIQGNSEKFVSVEEPVEIESEFEVGDNVEWINYSYDTHFGNRFGKVIKVIPKDDFNKIPRFTYMVEFPNGARHIVEEKQLIFTKVKHES